MSKFLDILAKVILGIFYLFGILFAALVIYTFAVEITWDKVLKGTLLLAFMVATVSPIVWAMLHLEEKSKQVKNEE